MVDTRGQNRSRGHPWRLDRGQGKTPITLKKLDVKTRIVRVKEDHDVVKLNWPSSRISTAGRVAPY